MNLQAENQASAAVPSSPARIDPLALVPILLAETGPPAENKPDKPCGSSGKQGKPGAKSMRAKRNLPDGQKKPNAKRGAEMKSAPAIRRLSLRKKIHIGSDRAIEQAAVQEQAIPSAAHASQAEESPAVCDVLPEQAPPQGSDEVAAQLRPSECEIPNLCGPDPNRSLPLWNEPDPTAAEPISLAKPDMLRPGQPSAQAEKRGLLTLTLRVRHSPLAVLLKSLDSRLTQAWNWTQQKLKSTREKKRLRVCESVSLGEKRFVAVIQVDGEQFLVGGSASSVSTLAHLERPREFSDVFRRHCTKDLSPA
jgi:hypothetical protein